MSLIPFSLSLIIFFSILFSRLKQPLSMGLTIIIQTIFIAFSSGMLSSSTWFSYILFLIFLGAMLVLFLYVALLAPNETFKLSTYMFIFFLMSIFSLMALFLMDQTMLPIKLSLEPSFFSSLHLVSSSKSSIGLMYSISSMNLTIFIIMYLLLTLIVVVKITSTFSGPLRTN